MLHGDVHEKISLIEKTIEQTIKNIRHQAAKQNLFENRIEGILKSTPSEAPLKKVDIDQDKLRYLDKRMGSLTKEFETLNESVKTRMNEIFIDLNKKSTIVEVEEKETKVYTKLDELMESLLKKFIHKEALKKHAKEIERHILFWYDWIMNIDKIKQDKEDDDGTMFSRKKIEGMSWASCGTPSVRVYNGIQPTISWDKMIGKNITPYYYSFI